MAKHACSRLGEIIEPKIKAALKIAVSDGGLKLGKEDQDYVVCLVVNTIEDELCS